MKKPKWLEKEVMREIIFGTDTRAGRAFDIALLVAIVLSLIVIFIESIQGLAQMIKSVLGVVEALLTILFTIEYAARIYSAKDRKGYILSGWGIIDLMAILPAYLTYFIPTARYMLVLRSIRFLRMFRIFRLFSFINEGHLLLRALGKSMHKIAVYFLFVFVLVVCLGTLMFIIENEQPGSSFTDIGTSIYWAITTLSTVGYGDITPVTYLGRLLSAFIMLLGYTLIAVPGGIVTASFINETDKPVRDGLCPRCGNKVEDGDNYCSHCGEKL
ncbi:MAG: ion transporter [Bacteroidaceae bacterium]|nr:ion transporter [Bacteroidaceae bacterium]